MNLQASRCRHDHDETMNENSEHELPIFPATAPPEMTSVESAKHLLTNVLEALAEVVDPTTDQLNLPTPCENFDVGTLREHTLGWLTFFAAALNDPGGVTTRPDPTTAPTSRSGKDIVEQASRDISAAIENGVIDRYVAMSEAQMSGGAVLAMALGEYIIHGWDLATSIGRPWPVFEKESGPALAFLQGTVQPEYRGPESDFFGAEVEAPEDATPRQRLLCFAGRVADQ